MSQAHAQEQSPLALRQSVPLVSLMWVAYFLNYCDRNAVFAMFPALRADLQLSDQQLGLIGSVFLWIYGFSCPVAGMLADRFSKRWLVIGSLVLWSLITTLTGFSTGIVMLLCLRGFMGIAEAMYMPAAVSLTANAHSSQHRSLAVSVLTTAQIAGTLVGAWFGGVMAEQGAWRSCFYYLGIVGVLYALPLWLFLLRIPEHRPTEPRRNSDVPGPKSALSVFQIRSYIVLCITFPIFVFGLWMLYGWLPNFFHEKFELTMGSAGFLATVYFQVAMLVGLIMGGWLADRLYSVTRAARLWLLALSLLMCAPALHVIGSATSLNVTCAATAVFGLFGGTFAGNIFPAAFEVVHVNQRASAVGWLNFFGALLSGFAPLLGGMLKRSIGLETLLTYTAAAYVVAAVCLVAGILVLFPQDFRKSG